MKLGEIIKSIPGALVYGDSDIEITHITNDSRACVKGSLFVAVRGFQTDGHKFIKSAVENGASAVMCEEYDESLDVVQVVSSNSRISESIAAAEFYSNPSKSFKLVGITGTNGKTTVTYLVKSILEYANLKVGLIGTNQNMIGDEVIETSRTTPDSIELQSVFARMRDANVDVCVMEVSSHALELERVHGCTYSVGAFTNLTQDHLDFHITMDNYANAKFKLMEISEKAVINTDDSYGKAMADKCPCECLTYSTKNENSKLYAENIEMHSDCVKFDVKDIPYRLMIPGEFSVYNALCAIGVARALGIDENTISKGLEKATGVKGRAEVVPTGRDYTVIIDYAHTPDGIENILNAVRGFCKGRVIIVFGCGGDRDNTKRPIMGKIAGKMADFCVVTSDNPRTENPLKIISMVEEGVKESGGDYVVIESRRDAIKYALDNAKKDDCIVLAGKGHETYQILNSGTIHFDEREVVKDILCSKA